MKESHWLYFLQIYTVSFYNFFLWPTVSVQRHLTNTYQLARDMFIFMDSAIICIHFINIQLPISSKITAVFLIIRNTVVITLTHTHTHYYCILLLPLLLVVVAIVIYSSVCVYVCVCLRLTILMLLG